MRFQNGYCTIKRSNFRKRKLIVSKTMSYLWEKTVPRRTSASIPGNDLFLIMFLGCRVLHSLPSLKGCVYMALKKDTFRRISLKIHSFMYSFIHTFIYPFIYSLIYPKTWLMFHCVSAIKSKLWRPV